MTKKQTGTGSSNKIANKLIRLLKRGKNQKVVDLNLVKQIRQLVSEQKPPSPEEMSGSHPAYSMYILAQHMLVNIFEILQYTHEMSKFTKKLIAAEDEYLPSGPPMSPITYSHFFGWSFLDLTVGSHKETLVDVINSVTTWAGFHKSYQDLFENFSKSRMGLYLHQDETDQCVTFSEIGTGIKIKAIMNSQYSGKTGDIWLTRILAPPHPTLPVGVVFGTPYQILGSSMQEWESFLDRTYSKTKQKTQQESHEYLMKFGLSWNYWLEYVFEAYVNYAPNLIYLKGFPDIDESRPHSKANY